jgi:hypothetical protein
MKQNVKTYVQFINEDVINEMKIILQGERWWVYLGKISLGNFATRREARVCRDRKLGKK